MNEEAQEALPLTNELFATNKFMKTGVIVFSSVPTHDSTRLQGIVPIQ